MPFTYNIYIKKDYIDAAGIVLESPEIDTGIKIFLLGDMEAGTGSYSDYYKWTISYNLVLLDYDIGDLVSSSFGIKFKLASDVEPGSYPDAIAVGDSGAITILPGLPDIEATDDALEVTKIINKIYVMEKQSPMMF